MTISQSTKGDVLAKCASPDETQTSTTVNLTNIAPEWQTGCNTCVPKGLSGVPPVSSLDNQQEGKWMWMDDWMLLTSALEANQEGKQGTNTNSSRIRWYSTYHLVSPRVKEASNFNSMQHKAKEEVRWMYFVYCEINYWWWKCVRS